MFKEFTREEYAHGHVWVAKPDPKNKCRVITGELPVTECWRTGSIHGPPDKPCNAASCAITDKIIAKHGPLYAAHFFCRKSGARIFQRMLE